MNIPPVGGIGVLALRQEYAVRTAALIKDAAKDEGDRALKLLAAAMVPPETGGRLDVRA